MFLVPNRPRRWLQPPTLASWCVRTKCFVSYCMADGITLREGLEACVCIKRQLESIPYVAIDE